MKRKKEKKWTEYPASVEITEYEIRHPEETIQKIIKEKTEAIRRLGERGKE